jgi:LacI family transcriptional regulator
MSRSAAELLASIEANARVHERIREHTDALAEKRRRAAGARSLVIGVATVSWEYMSSPAPIFLGIFEGIKSRARASDCDVLLFTTIAPDPDIYLRRCRDNNLSGVILHGFSADDARISRLLEADVPCVGVDDVGLAPRLGHVSSDNVGGAIEAVRHLFSRGRRRIATIHAPVSHSVGERRLLGYRIGLEQAGLPHRSEYEAQGDFHLWSGSEGMERLLALEDPPDGVFAASDIMAIGAMSAIERVGLRVPDDIAVVGYDDIAEATLVSPQLTTVRQDAVAQGTAATEGLLRMISDPSSNPIELIIPIELIVRESTTG